MDASDQKEEPAKKNNEKKMTLNWYLVVELV